MQNAGGSPAVDVDQTVGEGVAYLLEHAKHRANGDERVYHSEELLVGFKFGVSFCLNLVSNGNGACRIDI